MPLRWHCSIGEPSRKPVEQVPSGFRRVAITIPQLWPTFVNQRMPQSPPATVKNPRMSADFRSILMAREDDLNWQRQRIDFGELSSTVATRGLLYWKTLRGELRYPSRKQVNPRDIAPLLRNVLVVRVRDGGEEFEYRVAGDVVVQLHGSWLTNSTTTDLDSHFPGYGRLVRRIYSHIVNSGEPMASRGEVQRQTNDGTGAGVLFQHETVFLPLGEHGGPVDHILVFCDVLGANMVPAK